MRFIALLLAALCLTLAAEVVAQQPSKPAPPTDPELLRALDRDIWNPFVEAYGAGRPDDYFALHSRSLIRVTAGAKRIEPWDQWQAGTRAMFKSFADRGTKPAIRFRFTERIANADTASERGVFEFTLTPVKGEPRKSYGRFHVLSRKEDGRWKIVADYDSDEGGTVNAASFEAAHAPEDYARY